MGKVNLTEASLINERDRTPKCESCFAMADEGEKFCMSCKMYWEQDVPAMNAIQDRWETEDDWS